MLSIKQGVLYMTLPVTITNRCSYSINYQAGHDGGAYLAARAAIYLAIVCRQEVASQAQAGHDTHAARSLQAASKESLSQAYGCEQDTTRLGEEIDNKSVYAHQTMLGDISPAEQTTVEGQNESDHVVQYNIQL